MGTDVYGSFSDSFFYSQKETPKKENPPESPANSVTVVLFCMWIMVLVYGERTRIRKVRSTSPC